ncbi:MAG: FAD-dependent oxidoreductase [Caldimonas sp.]
MTAKRVAVVGSGIAGLAAARALAASARVTLFESDDRFGGHAHTVDFAERGVRHGVDCGFLVYNERTYPRLIALFAELGVATAPSDMSFSVQVPGADLEWSGSSLNSVFAQRRNLSRPAFWAMLADIVRFNRLANRLVGDEAGTSAAALDLSIGDFLDQHRFGLAFRDWYFLPMIGSIWSCPTGQMLQFPIATMIRFCHNHGLLQVTGRPRWHTVRGGARHYVARMLESIADARSGTPVRGVRRRCDGGVDVATDAGSQRFDAVVLACHSEQSLALLGDAAADERSILGAIRTQPNRAVLHTDARLLPRRKPAWAAWNYERDSTSGNSEAPVCLHYLINRLQPLPFTTPVIVSLNPVREPQPAAVHGEFRFAHPVFDAAAIRAQSRLDGIQGRGGVWYCGAWTRYGFHEDGLVSGLAAGAGAAAALAGVGSPS